MTIYTIFRHKSKFGPKPFVLLGNFCRFATNYAYAFCELWRDLMLMIYKFG